MFDEGVYEDDFRVVEAPSRLAAAQHIVEEPYEWKDFLERSRLFDGIARGNAPYYADPDPVMPEEALALIDASHINGDSIVRLSIHPITEILTLAQ